MTRETTDKAARAALSLAAETPFNDITLAAIAAEAGLDLGALYDLRTRDDLLAAILQAFDPAMSADGPLLKGPPRERLFDAIMLRFEAMEPERAGLEALLKYAGRSPMAMIKLGESHLRAAQWALASAGLDTDEGAPRSVKALSLARVIAKTEKAWREDQHGDFARTMAELDKTLRDAENRLAWFSRFSKRAETKPNPEPQPE